MNWNETGLASKAKRPLPGLFILIHQGTLLTFYNSVSLFCVFLHIPELR